MLSSAHEAGPWAHACHCLPGGQTPGSLPGEGTQSSPPSWVTMLGGTDMQLAAHCGTAGVTPVWGFMGWVDTALSPHHAHGALGQPGDGMVGTPWGMRTTAGGNRGCWYRGC